MLNTLWNDETGAILSAEIVLVGTILIVGMIVGLVELQCSVVDELNDLGEAVGSANQRYQTSGTVSFKQHGEVKGTAAGSFFEDRQDSCDGNECEIICTVRETGEAPKGL